MIIVEKITKRNILSEVVINNIKERPKLYPITILAIAFNFLFITLESM